MSGIKLLKSKKIGGSKSGNIFNSSGEYINNIENIANSMIDTAINKIVIKQIADIIKGGKKISAKSEYINKLKKYGVKTLKSYASKINIKTTKRLNGKLVSLTKEALIKRLANYKYKK